MKEFEKIVRYKNVGGDMFEAAEVGDLVRCKDCIIRTSLLDYKLGYDGMCNLHVKFVNDSDFCSWGKRRPDNGKTD